MNLKAGPEPAARRIDCCIWSWPSCSPTRPSPPSFSIISTHSIAESKTTKINSPLQTSSHSSTRLSNISCLSLYSLGLIIISYLTITLFSSKTHTPNSRSISRIFIILFLLFTIKTITSYKYLFIISLYFLSTKLYSLTIITCTPYKTNQYQFNVCNIPINLSPLYIYTFSTNKYKPIISLNLKNGNNSFLLFSVRTK